jgi:hypothetical protein
MADSVLDTIDRKKQVLTAVELLLVSIWLGNKEEQFQKTVALLL